MKKRIFRTIFMVAAAALVLAALLMGVAIREYDLRLQLNHLETETALAARGVEAEGTAYLEKLDLQGISVMWITPEGNTFFSGGRLPEKDPVQEEVQKAFTEGFGTAVRPIPGEYRDTLWAARRLDDGTVLRFSAEYRAGHRLLILAVPIGAALLVAAVLSIWMAGQLARQLVSPLNRQDLNPEDLREEYAELRPLFNRITAQRSQLSEQAMELKRKQRELDTVTRNMTEGLVLMNERCTVLTMNPAAARIMGLVRPYVGIDFRTLEKETNLDSLLQKALSGSHSEESVSLPGGVYQIDASPVKAGGQVSGVALLMFDVTQKHLAEVQRREFSANVTHELKTPLHVISGYAELMKSGLVPQEDMQRFSEKIYGETQRMTGLVEDILKLSRLDEGAEGMPWEKVDLYQLAEETVRCQLPAAQRADVTLTLTGKSCMMEGIPQLLTGILTNLCSNAIKYNRPGGNVEISVAEQEHQVNLCVSDTGIGIPPEHQDRVFERFYRVDKSHSKAVGGTGLGLSIVKHAAHIHNARIELISVRDQGTRITLKFPK